MSWIRVGFSATKNIISYTSILPSTGCQGCSTSISPGYSLYQYTQIQSRNYSFVNKVGSDQLWGGVTSVSAAGRKRGRTKSVKRRINLNIGQKIGYGKKGMQLPGLNTWVLTKSNERIKAGSQTDEQYEITLDSIRDFRGSTKKSRHKRKFPNPLNRGYNSSLLNGTSLGMPAPVRDETFEGFDSVLIEGKKVTNITATEGKVFASRALVAVGNGNGLAGFAVAKAKSPEVAAIKARDKAGQRLMFIERYKGHTIHHNTHAEVHCTKLFAKRTYDGHGVVAHKVIKDLCRLSGIKDIYIKLEGNTKNRITMTTAFFNAMTHQETHQELANRTNMHVVEFSEERNNVPVVLASPEDGKVQEKYYGSERDVYDLDTLYTKGKLHWTRPQMRPVWERLKFTSYQRRMAKEFRRRGQHEAQKVRRLCGLEPSKEERMRRDEVPKKEE